MRPVEAVIFDFGGVFTTSPVENFTAFEKAHGLPDRFIGDVIKANHHANAWARFERAEISLDEFDRQFAEETRAAGHEIDGADLVALLALKVRPEMVSALVAVKAAGFKTGCITNNLPDMNADAILAPGEDRRTVAAIFGMFDHVIESSKAGVRKPEPRIYAMMCEALGVAPEACIFVDDLGINLKPAKAMGMRTIKAPLGDISPAIRELEAILGRHLRE